MYRVVDDDWVAEQVAALPAEALSGYAEVRTLLEVAPWSGSPYRKEKPDGPMRTLTFGSSGAVTLWGSKTRCSVLTCSLRVPVGRG